VPATANATLGEVLINGALVQVADDGTELFSLVPPT